MELVIEANTSIRGAAKVLALFCPASAPSFSTGRLWLLRFGLYVIERNREQAEDWIWLADHTIQVGQEKCLVVLGVSLNALREREDITLRYEDVRPIALVPVSKSNEGIVQKQFEALQQQVGTPRAIICDGAGDLQAGVRKFCVENTSTAQIYDIKHKVATEVKRSFKDDAAWQEFEPRVKQSKARMKQSAVAALAPPKQRDKARWLNFSRTIRWARLVLAYLDRLDMKPLPFFLKNRIREKLDWLKDYRAELVRWQNLMTIAQTVEDFVRRNGIFRGVTQILRERLSQHIVNKRESEFAERLLSFLSTQEQICSPDERLPASTEVLESVLGKLKYIEANQVYSGFTALVLCLGAITTPLEPRIVRDAMTTISPADVSAWQEKNLGQTVQAQRIDAFRSARIYLNDEEQKWNQLQRAA